MNYQYQGLELELGIQLPDQFNNYDETMQDSVIKYLKQLDPIEKKAYTIGKSHLGSSFNVVKSNGYINWKKNNK
jgi:hypothetical protein